MEDVLLYFCNNSAKRTKGKHDIVNNCSSTNDMLVTRNPSNHARKPRLVDVFQYNLQPNEATLSNLFNEQFGIAIMRAERGG